VQALSIFGEKDLQGMTRKTSEPKAPGREKVKALINSRVENDVRDRIWDNGRK